MIKSKDIFLAELAKHPQLSENVIAFVFASNPDIDISSKERYFDNVTSYYNRYKNVANRESIEATVDDIESEIDTWTNRDLRIKSVRLKSVRGYPDSDKPFGVDFTNDDGESQSMVILGSNASGKSSLFDSIEYSYCRSIGEALLRAYKQGSSEDVKFKHYLEHFNNGEHKIYCKVETMSDVFDILDDDNIPEPVRRKVNPDTHFISDFDIYTKGQLDYEENNDRSFHNTIAESMGLTELLKFEKKLKSFVLYRRQTENRQISGLNKNIDTQRKIVENNEKAIAEKQERLRQLRLNQKDVPEEKSIKEVSEKLNQIRETSFSLSYDYQQLSTQIEEFKRAYNDFISKEIKNGGYNQLQFLNLGLELIKGYDNCPFCDNSTLSQDEISLSVKNRIEKIKSLNESVQRLNKTSNSAIEIMTYLPRQLALLSMRVQEELNIIQDKVEFNELTQVESSFWNELVEFMGADYFTELSDLNENPNYLKNKNKFLIELLETHNSIIQNKIPKIIESVAQFSSNRSKLIQKVEQQIENKTKDRTLAEQLIIINKEIRDLEIQLKYAKGNIETDKARIAQIQEKQALFDEIKKETDAYLNVVHQSLSKEVKMAFAPIKLVVEEIIENYFEMDNRDTQLVISKQPEETDEETGEILSEVIAAHIIHKDASIPPQPVGKYLNNFHYRLFSTMVGISIAIASRINTGINLPLVLDDIFYSSDFENRVSIEEFVREIFEIFKKYTPELPLQLIFFTHDQMIFESVMKATQELQFDKIDFAKLFTPDEAKEEEDFLNLIYRLPHNLPQQIMETVYL